jgi:hypothetical protein
VLLRVIPKLLDLQGRIMFGQGIARFTSSQLPDAVIGPNGALTPLTSLSLMVGAIAHPFAGNDMYFHYGHDQTNANDFRLWLCNAKTAKALGLEILR